MRTFLFGTEKMRTFLKQTKRAEQVQVGQCTIIVLNLEQAAGRGGRTVQAVSCHAIADLPAKNR